MLSEPQSALILQLASSKRAPFGVIIQDFHVMHQYKSVSFVCQVSVSLASQQDSQQALPTLRR